MVLQSSWQKLGSWIILAVELVNLQVLCHWLKNNSPLCKVSTICWIFLKLPDCSNSLWLLYTVWGVLCSRIIPHDRCSCLCLLIASCSQHSICSHSLLDLKVWIQFSWPLQHTIQMQQPSSTLAHFTFCGSQWRWMCPLQYSSFWVKCWTHVSQRHHGFREPVCSSFKWLKKWKSTCQHKFLWTSITFLGTHHAHTLLYPSCTWTMLGTVFTNHSSAMDKSWIVA